jgi:hypothetical protein
MLNNNQYINALIKYLVKLCFDNRREGIMLFMMLLNHLLNLKSNTNHINQCQIVIKNEI